MFGDEVLTTAILDRLLHHCEVISTNGPSCRLKNRLQAIERESDVAWPAAIRQWMPMGANPDRRL